MNRQPLLLVGFGKYTYQGLLVKTNLIISNMTGHALKAFSGILDKKVTV